VSANQKPRDRREYFARYYQANKERINKQQRESRQAKVTNPMLAYAIAARDAVRQP